jgi:hypothetical protein
MGWFSGPSEFEKRLQVVADQLESTNQWTEEMIADFNACMPNVDQAASPAMSKLNALMQNIVAKANDSDYFKWGGWNSDMHSDPDQEKRQNRGANIDDDDVNVNFEDGTAEINGYMVYLNHCTCPDFQERKLPCKHIYRLAFELDLPI